MQKLFDEVASLDAKCYKDFFLTEDILMEHAANGMAAHIKKNFQKNAKVLIVAGSGNNGADGITLARLLHKDFHVSLLLVKKPKSKMAQLQLKRAQSLHIPIISTIHECDVLVEALVGTGFQGVFNEQLLQLIEDMNHLSAYKIACDTPSDGFYADVTFTMGALKKGLFLDNKKDFVGAIEVLDLGLSRKLYETDSNWNLLDYDDLQLPKRVQKDSHKGTYGHLAVISGEKLGASVLCGSSALRFGAGLVSLVSYEREQFCNIPHSLMCTHSLPKNATAIAIGMGLGLEFSQDEMANFLDHTLSLVVDADLFYRDIILDIVKRKNIVLTPHPKEFIALLKLTNLADIEMDELQNNRFKYAQLFCEKYPHATLLLKGANVVIGQKDAFYINPHGSAKLAKGGSGDVLSGLIGSLLAQGYEPLKAAINASLAHTKLAQNYLGTDFSLTPEDLIQGIRNL